MEKTAPHRTAVAIVGAGIAGLSAAERLVAEGLEVRLWDKSRGVGGRLATRRADGRRINHGAPDLDITRAEFRAWLMDHGAAIRGDRATCADGMSRLLRPLAERIGVAHGVEIAEVGRSADRWQLRLADGSVADRADAVILALPAPQAARIAPALAGDLAPVTMDPVWTLLLAFDDVLSPPDAPSAPFAAIATTPGQPGTAWACHTTPDFAAAHLETDKPAMAERLFHALQAQTGTLPAPRYRAAHRWRYGRTRTPLGRAFAGDPATGLLAGGDWALGPQAEDAWRSGCAMAEALLSNRVSTRTETP